MSPLDGTLENIGMFLLAGEIMPGAGKTLLRTLVSRGRTIGFFDKWGGKIVLLFNKATLFHQFQII